MTFYSVAFVIFFLILCICVNATKGSIKQQNAVFLIANIIFYAYWDYRFLALLFLVILICYVGPIYYEITKKNICIILPICLCISVLFVFKYFDFFVSSFCDAFGIRNAISMRLILPLGLSFYIFQAISYLADVKMGKVRVERDLVKLAAYLSFFAQITAGPIVKAREFIPQLGRIHRINKSNFSGGFQQFLWGLTKKIVIADRIAIAVDAVYKAPNAYNGISVTFAIIGYAVQIYCDFSGYSDMAIGIAKILDFDLGQNFDLPYFATNPADFWRRWHISLSSWFREYVYIPLGGNRKGEYKTYRNLFITMILSGLWHGSNWTFVVWGFAYAVVSVVHKYCNKMHKMRQAEKHSEIRNILFTMANTVMVFLLWVPFRATSLGHAWDILRGMVNREGIMYVNVYTVVYGIILLIIGIYMKRKNNGHVIVPNFNLNRFSGKVILCTWILVCIMYMYIGDSNFIYANF